MLNNIIYITRILPHRFLRELNILKIAADYQSCDGSKLDDWLKQLGAEFKGYSYQMLINGVDRVTLRWLTEEHLERDCMIRNGIHRMKILEATKRQYIEIYKKLKYFVKCYPGLL